MDATSKQALVKAIELIKSGDRQSAVPLLANVLKRDPGLVQAWYLLGLAVDTEDRKIKAFQQALKLDPGHEKAQQQLAKLQPPAEQAAPPAKFKTEPLPPPASAEMETAPSEFEQGEPGEPLPFPEGLTEFSPPSFDTPSDKVPAGVQPDFELPEWIGQDTSDSDDYHAGEESEIYTNTEDEIPEWAQMNPFAQPPGTSSLTPPPPAAEPKSKPGSKPDSPDWSQAASKAAPPEEPAPDMPDWAIKPDDPEDEENIPDQYADEPSDLDRVAAFFEKEDQGSTAPEEPDWLQENVTGDGKKKKRRKKEFTPAEKKRRRWTIIFLILTVLCVGLSTGGYLFREKLAPLYAAIQPYTDQVLGPVKTQAAPITDLLTQGVPLTYLLTPNFNQSATPSSTIMVQPSALPTWTPQPTKAPPTATPRATRQPGETPTVTPTPIPLPNEIVAQMKEIEGQIISFRGLGGPANPARVLLPKQQLLVEMENALVNEDLLSSLNENEIVLRALGFINTTTNLDEAYLSAKADPLGGFYLPENDTIYIIGSTFDGFSVLEQYIYTKEFASAIQDQNFNLLSLGNYPECIRAEQACDAIRALTTGEASLVAKIWLEEFPPKAGTRDILNANPPNSLFQPAPLPYFAMKNEFAAVQGLAFVEYLYDNGGWNAVNRAFSILPTTTEQILHPEKYQAREEIGPITPPGFSDLLPQEWALIAEDALGEWDSYLLLAASNYPGAARPKEEAAIAAAGWGADQYQVYYNPEEQHTLLNAYWVWDSVEDGTQFYDSLEASLSARFGNARVDSDDGGVCWAYRQQKSCIQQDGQKVYWLLSDDAVLLDSLRERFKLFP